MPRRRALVRAAALAIAATGSLFAQTHTISVPFVGCPSVGQAGPVEAPKGTAFPVAITREAAEHLADYDNCHLAVEPYPTATRPKGHVAWLLAGAFFATWRLGDCYDGEGSFWFAA